MWRRPRHAQRTRLPRATPVHQRAASPAHWHRSTRSLAVLADHVSDRALAAHASNRLCPTQASPTPLNATGVLQCRQPVAYRRCVGDEASDGTSAFGDHDRLALPDLAHAFAQFRFELADSDSTFTHGVSDPVLVPALRRD